MKAAALAADEPEPLTFTARLAELLPSHAYFESVDTSYVATWSTPRGLWAITFTPLSCGTACKTQIKGPKTLLELGNTDLGLIAKALSVLGAVSLVVLDDEMVLDEQNGNVRPLKFSSPIGRGKPPRDE